MSEGSVMMRSLGFLVLVVSGMASAYAAMLFNDREVPVVVLDMEALTPRVPQGGTLRVRYVVRRFRTCHTSVDRQIYDSTRTRFVLNDLDFPAGLPLGDDVYVVPVPVPLDAALGAATYRVMVEYKCNVFHRLRPIAAPARDVLFTITKGEEE